jgi:tetratricopeptide (TPR) repeat protein
MSSTENDDLESAKILIQENLLDEAKRTLFRLIAHHGDPASFVNLRAREMLQSIETIEMKNIHSWSGIRERRKPRVEDADRLIEKLERDLQFTIEEDPSSAVVAEQWAAVDAMLTVRDLLDLAVGYFEMGCYPDAIRELKKAEKKIRIEESFLGELGVSIVALHAQSLIELGQAFDARIYLEPILLEPDLPHEQKIILYYTMGLAEQALENKNTAKAWFQKVKSTEPGFRDVDLRIRILEQNP